MARYSCRVASLLGIMNINQIHKKIDKQEDKKLKELNDEMLVKFIRFQVENNARAIVMNQFSGQDLIVDIISQYSILKWAPLNEQEKQELQSKLAKQAGIDIAQIELPRK